MAQQCIARLGWEDCVIYLLDRKRQVLVQKAAWGLKSSPDQKIVSPVDIPVGQGIVGTVARTGQAELVADTAADPRNIVDNAPRASELAVPILMAGQVIGVIDSEHSEKGFYTSWHLQLLTAIASLLRKMLQIPEYCFYGAQILHTNSHIGHINQIGHFNFSSPAFSDF